MQLRVFLEPKINWKLYNYIVYILTKYEDMGYIISFGIYMKTCDKGSLGRLYYEYKHNRRENLYVNNYNEIGVGRDIQYVKDSYKMYGLFYIIRLWENDGTVIIDSNIQHDIVSKLSKKMQHIYNDKIDEEELIFKEYDGK